MDRRGLLCRTILEHPEITQRELAQVLELSLGTVNGLVRECISLNYIATLENSVVL